MLSDRLDKLGIKYIDLLPSFSENSGERLYRVRDTHWNIAGNQLAANIIQAHIVNYVRENAKYRYSSGGQQGRSTSQRGVAEPPSMPVQP